MNRLISFVGRMMRALLPAKAFISLERLRRKVRWRSYEKLSTQERFTRIYLDRAWGDSKDSDRSFFSGTGSDRGIVADTYIGAIRSLMTTFDTKLDAVDLGCGDFYVGSKLRPMFGRYTACDIVAPLIEFNRQRYSNLDVDFRVLDLSQNELPAGDIVFIRQVLQHLSNAHIAKAVPRLASRYRFLIVTEHLPKGRFEANIDQSAGAENRVQLGSGVVLTDAPFNMRVRSERILCEVPEAGGIIRTTAYEL